jgi:diaminopimelate decarboxylase
VFCGREAGFAPEDIVLSGSNLGEEDLAYLRDAGVHVNLDSLDDLGRALATPGLREIGLRLHLDDVLPESRVGLREADLDQALAMARAAGRPIRALHVYCGTHGQDVDRYRRAAARLVDLAAGLPDVTCVNLGGGFGYDYLDPEGGAFPFAEVGAAAGEALEDLSRRTGRRLLLRAEPGRAMVAGAAVLLTRVRSVKRGKGRRYVGVDTTTANFTSPVVHGSHRRVVALRPRPASDGPADVCGATTFSRDFVAKEAPLPEVEVGDLLAVLDAGAYGYCMSSHFLNRPRPAEVFVDAGEARLVTRRETFADLVRAQVG